MKQNNVEIIVENYLQQRTPEHRYTSFDYCYNYFNSGDDLTKDMEKSCNILAFYLASWGMFRGSSFLLQKNAKYFSRTIEYINSLDKSIWNIDVDKYDQVNISKILEIYKKLDNLIVEGNSRSITLVTKMMLGIFGFVPAYDEYFCKTFRKIANEKCRFRRFNQESLKLINEFFIQNKDSINNLSNKTYTLDLKTGNKTNLNYPKAKIIDMYGFTLSLK